MPNLTRSELAVLIAEDVPDVEDLCMLLEIDTYDILEAFPEKMEEHLHKFMLPACTDGILDDDDEEETEEWPD